MADYYTELSFIVECKQGDQALLLRMLAQENKRLEDAGEWGLSVAFEENEDGIWFHDDEGAVNIEALCDVLQLWLSEISDDTRSIGFEWANTCSKPRLDAFGGGAAFIRKDEVRFMNTGSWLHERQIEDF